MNMMVLADEYFFIYLVSRDCWNLTKYKKYGKALCPTSVVDKRRVMLELYIWIICF